MTDSPEHSLPEQPRPSHTAPSTGMNTGLWLLLIILLLSSAAFTLRRLQESRDMAIREQKVLPMINAAAARHGLDPDLVRAVVWRESRFRQHAIGSKGEIGLMQLMPGATKDWASVHKCPIPHPRGLHDIHTNLEIGCWYLAKAQRQWQDYASCAILQLAQYNAGRATVLREWAPKEKTVVLTPKDITYPTTRQYVQTILDKQHFYKEARKKQKKTGRIPSSGE